MNEPRWLRRSGTAAVVVTCGGWCVVLGMILRHRIFVSSDTVSNYAHVWYVSRVLADSHRIPYHMSIIGHGRGLAFPYAFVPWLSAAIVRPLLGDWVVTLWLVIGSVGLAITTFWAFPELRRGWWAALVLTNPVLILGAVLGQLPFAWAMAFFLGAVACWRRGWTVWAIVLAGLGQATHAAVVLPIAAMLVVAWLPWEPNRRRLLLSYAASVLIAAPAVWLVFLTPAYTDSSTGVKLVNFVETVFPRTLAVAIPIALVGFRRVARPWMQPVVLALFIAASVALVATQHDTARAWRDLAQEPDHAILPFVHSADFQPGVEYRVLSTTDRRMSMYQLIEHGARLDSEFFPESLDRRTWSSEGEYCRFLRKRGVDRVVIYRGYDGRYHKNEAKLLRLLSSTDHRACDADGVTVRLIVHRDAFDVYGVNR